MACNLLHLVLATLRAEAVADIDEVEMIQSFEVHKLLYALV